MDIKSAVDAPRFHHQWKPDKIYMEKSLAVDEILKPLLKMGHNPQARSSIGHVNAITLDNKNTYVGADRRGDNYGETLNK